MQEKATLYLIPTPIGNLDDITIRSLKTLELVDVIFCEDTRETQKLLKKYNIKNKLISCHEYNEEEMTSKVLYYLEMGSNVGLVTDQGTPLISDPGYKIVEYIASFHYNIISLPGPTAFVPALTVSALPPQPFLFYGFLNAKEGKQKKELEKLKAYPFTMIFYESPHRLMTTLKNMKDIFGARRISISREISKKFEQTYRGSLEELENIELKGEFVLVVEGSREKVDFSDLSMIEHVDLYIEDGLSTKEAMKKVAEERGLAKSIIYKEYQQKKEGE